MQTRRSSVLGKRTHQSESTCDSIPTPESTPNPKRVRVSTSVVDGDGNKENVPPFRITDSSSPVRPLRRSSTDLSTPSRPQSTPRRHASTSNLAPTLAHLALSTPPPTPPTSQFPIHVRARALLRATCDSPGHLAGRDEERGVIQHFLSSFFDSEENTEMSTLYISGSPGTGKTALVNSVLRDVDESEVKVLSVNCMALSSVDALWERLLEELQGSNKKAHGKKAKGKEAVENALSNINTKCILLLDELDHIVASLSSLSALFSPLSKIRANLRIIGIANTHTLTASSPAKTKTASSIQTLHFAPYTPPQLLAVLNARLSLLEGPEAETLLPQPALTLLAQKIAAQTGDVRALFEVLRGAIDRAASANNKSSIGVSPIHILAALKAYAPAGSRTGARLGGNGSSEIVSKVRGLGLQARLVLLTVLLASRRLEAGLPLSPSPSSPTKSPVKRTASTALSPTGTIDTMHLHAYYTTALTRAEGSAFSPASRSEFGDLLGVLETSGLVSLSLSPSGSPSKGGRRTFGRSASFGGIGSGGAGGGGGGKVKLVEGVRGEEVLRGLGIVDSQKGEEMQDVREEEVKAIWEREKKRIGRDVKALGTRGKAMVRGFEDAIED